jgi:hypothetical protein
MFLSIARFGARFDRREGRLQSTDEEVHERARELSGFSCRG